MSYVNPIPDGYEPVEVIIRHPDFEDDVYLYGLDHRVVHLDLGGPFDITKLGPSDREQIDEWVAGVREQIADLPDDHPARETIEETIGTVLEAVE